MPLTAAFAVIFMSVIADHIESTLISAFAEDHGFGDITSEAIFNGQHSDGVFIAKSDGILSGVDAISIGYLLMDPDIIIDTIKQDGDLLRSGDEIARVSGPAAPLLTGERAILNLIQHLSGIATATNRAVTALGESKTRVCDTRKTLPSLRSLQKYAVRCGGGFNHRMRLDDGLMIKDNHIIAAGGITNAVSAARNRVGLMVKVEVECETEAEVKEAVTAGADIIMLDNKTPEQVKVLRTLIPNHILVELSGGITPDTIARYHDCGADYISLGSLTHSVKALDISFNLLGGKKDPS